MVPTKDHQKLRIGGQAIEQTMGAAGLALQAEEQVKDGSAELPNGHRQENKSLVNGYHRNEQGVETGHTETSPLLRRDSASSSSASGTSRQTKPSPFLGDISNARFWLIFSQILLASVVVAFDMTIMASSHPVITSYFHASHLASWLSTVFMLTSTVTQPLAGRLSDAMGRKPLFVGGMCIFTVSTTWCALAGSMESFILARAVSGLGAGFALCVGGIITSDLIKIEYRGSYQGYLNLTFGLGSSAGAALGGVMAENLGWRWEFGVQVPPLILSIVIAYLSLPGDLGIKDTRKSVRQTIREFDSLGSIILVIFITFMILGLNLGGNYMPWSHPFIITSLVICAIFGVLFIWAEKRAKLPVVPLNLLTTPPRANVIFTNFLCGLLTQGILFNLPLYFQAVMLTSATSSGLRLVLPTVVTSLAGAATGFTINYTGRIKWPVAGGPVLYAIGLVSLVLLQRHLHPIVYHLVLVPSFIGQGLQMPGTFMALLGSSAQEEQAVVTAVLTLFRSMGMVLGIALSSLTVQNALLHYLPKYVHGDRAKDIIDLARMNVEAIRDMPEPYREQVVRSYEATLRLTFFCGLVVSVMAILVIAPAKLKRLPPKQ